MPILTQKLLHRASRACEMTFCRGITGLSAIAASLAPPSQRHVRVTTHSKRGRRLSSHLLAHLNDSLSLYLSLTLILYLSVRLPKKKPLDHEHTLDSLFFFSFHNMLTSTRLLLPPFFSIIISLSRCSPCAASHQSVYPLSCRNQSFRTFISFSSLPLSLSQLCNGFLPRWSLVQ
jgi:hypothetical protein